MSGQLRALKNRIRSVENTKKITRAMEMVAAAKLRRFQNMMSDAKPYTDGLEDLVRRLHDTQIKKSDSKKDSGGPAHPFFEKREEKKKALIVITSDTGLCGSYNQDLIEMSKSFLAQEEEAPLLIGIGKMGISSLRALNYEFEHTFTDIRASRVEEILTEFKNALETLFLEKRVDSIYVVYSHFLTMTNYKGQVEKLLPLEEPESKEDGGDADLSYIFEPSPEVIFDTMIPLYFESKTRMVFLEAFVSEQIARMNAMHQATKNAKEMIDALVLLRNKIRQAAITKEIIEIVSGSQALKAK